MMCACDGVRNIWLRFPHERDDVQDPPVGDSSTPNAALFNVVFRGVAHAPKKARFSDNSRLRGCS